MTGLLFLAVILMIRFYLDSAEPTPVTPATNIYYNNGEPKCKEAIMEQVQKPARISYMMDHGTSITQTHEYCYISYLNLELIGSTLTTSPLFDHHSMTFTPVTKVSSVMLEAARCYLQDRAQYLGALN